MPWMFLWAIFIFSGYAQFAYKLADKYLRILVGLDIDTRISNRVREVEELVEWQRIRSKVREEYFNNLVRLINETDNTDTDETIRMFRQFQRKIYDGTLEIRKTEDPCHAKMYLFAYNDSNNENGEQPGDVITGSSDLSYQGLQGRTEINVRFTDKAFAVNAIKNDDLWNTIHHHREVFTHMRDVDYTPDIRDRIVLTPPAEHYQTWADDYADMQSSMIYGDSVSFDELLERMKELEQRFKDRSQI